MHGNWYVSCRLCERFLAESGWNQFQPDSARKWSHSLHETYQLPCIQQIIPDDGHRRCPKHVEFHDKRNVGYLMHLVGCFIRSLSRCRLLEHKITIVVCWDVAQCSLVNRRQNFEGACHLHFPMRSVVIRCVTQLPKHKTPFRRRQHLRKKIAKEKEKESDYSIIN